MRFSHLTVLLLTTGILTACVEEPPPPAVEDYVANKILLDAALAKCSADRANLKYTQECLNAREASNRIAKVEEEQRSEVLEAQSERKRAALRRAQMAAAEARRRAEEAVKLREEAEYLAQFGEGVSEGGEAMPVDSPETDAAPEITLDSPNDSTELAETADPAPRASEQAPAPEEPVAPATRGLQGPAFSGMSSGGDLRSIREELERRQNQRD